MDRREFLKSLLGIAVVTTAGGFASADAGAAMPVPIAPATAAAPDALLRPEAGGEGHMEPIGHWRWRRRTWRRRRRLYFFHRRRRHFWHWRRWRPRRRIYIIL